MITSAKAESNFPVWWPDCPQDTLILHFLMTFFTTIDEIFNDLIATNDRLPLMTWLPLKYFNITFFGWSSAPWFKKIWKFDDLITNQNTLMSHFLDGLLHHGWRKFLNLMTWLPPKYFLLHTFWMVSFTMVEENLVIWWPDYQQNTLLSRFCMVFFTMVKGNF